MAIHILYHPDDGTTFARTVLFDLRAHIHVDAVLDDGGHIDAVQRGDLVLVIGTALAHGSSFIAYSVSRAREAGAVIHWIAPDDHGLTEARRIVAAHQAAHQAAAQTEKGASPTDPDRSIPADLLDRLREAVDTTRGPGMIPPPAPEAQPADARADDPIQFSAYYPIEVRPNEWQPLRAYVFRQHAADDVERDAERELGDLLAGIRRAGEAARAAIREGALISAEPQLDGFQFNPPSASLAFFEDWQRFDFKLRAHTARPYAAVNGRITFRVEGVIVADLPLSIYVSPEAGAARPVGQTAAAARPYRAIFCSYSHRDTPVVLRIEKAIKVLGDAFLRDATTLRSGEAWNAGLLTLIDRADLFQLFWSAAAAQSRFVRQEWEYALARMNRERIPAFIRPVYWQEPMPPPPAELAHIHFAYDPTLDD